MIAATVALPLRNARDIAWLAMESLARQTPPTDESWELIVCEDHDTGARTCGNQWIDTFEPRLMEAGCDRIVYVACTERYPLSHKWHMMANLATRSSRVFLLQGADDYAAANRVFHAIQAHRWGFDWISQKMTAFYDIPTGKTSTFCADRTDNLIKIGPFIACDIQRVQRMVPDWIFSGNDMFVFRAIQPMRTAWVGDFEGSFCTNGANQISNRESWFDQFSPITSSTRHPNGRLRRTASPKTSPRDSIA